MNTLNSNPDFNLVPFNSTKSEAATILYPGITCDTALPQDWVNRATIDGFDVRPHFVWGYPDGSILGLPLPITQTGANWLST